MCLNLDLVDRQCPSSDPKRALMARLRLAIRMVRGHIAMSAFARKRSNGFAYSPSVLGKAAGDRPPAYEDNGAAVWTSHPHPS
jgi:hypothetical protein